MTFNPTPDTERDELRRKMGHLGFEWNKWDRSFCMWGTLFRVKESDAAELIKNYDRNTANLANIQKKQLLEAVLKGQKEYYEKHMNYAPDGDPSHVRLMAVPVSHIKKLMEEV